MKAIRIHEAGGPEVMRLEDVPAPEPSSGQVLVQIKAAGVNPVDTYLRAGTVYKHPLPYTPGIDGAGIVVSADGGAVELNPGTRVYVGGSVTGTYAELVVCNERQVHPIPDHISFEQGAGVYVPYATAYRALFQLARAQAGDTVLVHGASGGVGTAAVQFASTAGMRVVGTAGTESGRALAYDNGAKLVLDHRAPDYLHQAMDYTGGAGFDIILEMLANVNLAKDLPCLARNGRVVVIGNRGTIEIDPRDLMGRDAAILGMNLTRAPEDQVDRANAAVVAGLAAGILRPVVGTAMPLDEAAEAHRKVLEPGAHGKIVLIP